MGLCYTIFLQVSYLVLIFIFVCRVSRYFLLGRTDNLCFAAEESNVPFPVSNSSNSGSNLGFLKIKHNI